MRPDGSRVTTGAPVVALGQRAIDEAAAGCQYGDVFFTDPWNALRCCRICGAIAWDWVLHVQWHRTQGWGDGDSERPPQVDR